MIRTITSVVAAAAARKSDHGLALPIAVKGSGTG
jgi:hypothetical protein